LHALVGIKALSTLPAHKKQIIFKILDTLRPISKPNTLDLHGRTPVMVATCSQNYDELKYLLAHEHSASVNIDRDFPYNVQAIDYTYYQKTRKIARFDAY